MTDRPLSALESLVGTTRRTVAGFRVEPGKVAEFARAINDPAPTYLDAAGASGTDAVLAPPTFSRVAFFPRCRAGGVDAPLGFDLGFDREYVLHGQQRYEYGRPLRAGDVLHGETTLADVYRRDGAKGGTMTFAVLRTDFYDEDGERVQSAWNTRIETAGAADDDAGDTPTGDIDPAAAERGLHDGDVGPVVETDPLERRDFVQYAGASGDFNPVHYDEPHATAAGHPSVFAQGMFSAGVASRVLREWVGLDALDAYRTRFVSRAFPGDVLTARGRVATTEETIDGRRVELDVEVVAGAKDGADGEPRKVVEGSATATLAE
ncbi:MAG: MaoC family dehydratase N-terminal domain-containing protein [Halobacterium sp.]